VLPEGAVGVIGQARGADSRAERGEPAGDRRVGATQITGRGSIDDELADHLVREPEAGLAGLAHQPAALEPADRRSHAPRLPTGDPLKPRLVDVAAAGRSEQREPALVEARLLDPLAK